MSSRTTNIFLSPGEKVQIAKNTNWDDLHRAIGYLATWALDYPIVNIYREGPTDLVATYFNEHKNHVFTIGAVWHEDHYGFHS